LFDIVFRGVGVDGFLLCHFGEGFEFEDELEPYVLHVEAVLVGDGGESFLYMFEREMVSGTSPRFQSTMNIRIQICRSQCAFTVQAYAPSSTSIDLFGSSERPAVFCPYVSHDSNMRGIEP